MIKIKNYFYKGFTLVELLIVVAILGIIAAIGFPMYTGYIDSAREKEAVASIQAIVMMQEQYQLENNLTSYWTSGSSCSDHTKTIESTLFGNSNSLNDDHYFYCIISFNTSGYKVMATLKSDNSKILWMDNSNNKSW